MEFSVVSEEEVEELTRAQWEEDASEGKGGRSIIGFEFSICSILARAINLATIAMYIQLLLTT